MRHSIDPAAHGPLGEPMARAVQSCVHCGFCLAACPTYRELGQEMDSPRGRIVLMKEVLEGELALEAALPHVDRCLGCLACEPACPSGVAYRELVSPFRALAAERRTRPLGERLRRFLLASTLPYPERFRWAMRMGMVARRMTPLVPKGLRPMLELLPERLPVERSRGTVVSAAGQRRARVILLTGCAQRVLEPDINEATIEVLSRHGVEVVMPEGQGCCGALSWHVGELEAARKLARRNVEIWESVEADAVVTNAAGCGSALQEYPLILRGTKWEERARALQGRVCDVTVFLQRLGGLGPIPELERPMRVAYQDACHLAHGQGVTEAPRRLLAAVPGLQILELADGHLCCGSAGTYNIDQPELAASLGRQKVHHILQSGAELVVTGNIGCLTQLRMHLRREGSNLPVRHTVQVLRDAWAGRWPLVGGAGGEILPGPRDVEPKR